MALSFLQALIQQKKKKRRIRRPEIPMDLVMEEILTRLPAKSLMRFKCVSKLCSSFICSQYFSNRFLTVPSRPRPRLYMSLLDLKDYHKSVILSSAMDTTSPSSSSFVVEQDLTIPRMGGSILQNLRGFMCYTFWRKPRIYNPTTRQLVTLPAIKSNFFVPPRESYNIVCYYFGYDPVNDQYKVICSLGKSTILQGIKIQSEHWVFVLKAGGSWKKVAQTVCPHLPVRRALSVNGFIYYLAWIDMHNPVVVSFHIRSEEFKMIQVPQKDGDELSTKTKNVTLVEYGGKVTLFDQTHLRDKGMMDLWVLEDAGNKEWSRKTLVLQPSQLHLVNNITLKVKFTTQNGKVLLIPEDLISPFHFFSYDLQSNDMRKIEIKGIPDHWFSKDKEKKRFTLMFMDHSESITYLGT